MSDSRYTLPPGVDRLATIQLESSTACNAKCVFCPHPTMTRERGQMSQALFEKIVAEGCELGVGHYYPFLMGEPLADKRLPAWMQYVGERGAQFSLFTNAQLLTEDKVDWLLSCGNLHALWISFYGASREVYEAAMLGLHYETSKRNVERLIARVEALPEPQRPRLFVRMSTFELTAHETDAFREMWGPYAAITGHANWAGDRDSAYAQIDLPQWPCNRILDQIYITWDGQVVLCCMCDDLEVVLGDVNHEHVGEVWARMQPIRDRHRNYDFDMDLCRTCNVNRSAVDPWQGRFPRP